MIELYPLLLNPALHVRVWGGRRLEYTLHKRLPTDDPYGESWELHDTAAVANGPLTGRTLGDLLAEYGHALVGPENDPADGFPLLAKLIDAADWLSVQVHPDDQQARQLEGDPRGKTEAWYILDAQPGARLVIGIRSGTSKEAVGEAIRTNTLERLLVYAPVRAGDVLLLRAGTVHALGPGILVYEIQQSSDVTYRLYDWGRMGLDGKPRELHIDKGVAVAHLATLPQIRRVENDSATTPVVANEFFTTLLYRLDAAARMVQDTGSRFHALTCIEGSAAVEAGQTRVILNMGDSALVPASVPIYTLTGSGRVLCSYQT